MSDEVPAWALALEERLSSRISRNIDGLAAILESRIDVREHHLLTEITKAIADSEARLTHRLRELKDDVSVNMARADLAHTKIDADRAEITTLRRELVNLYRRLKDVEHRLFIGGPQPPEAA